MLCAVLCCCCVQEGKARVSAAPGVVPQLVALLQPGCGEQLQCAVLRLLHNLSFDGTLRQQMMGAGLVQQVGRTRVYSSQTSCAFTVVHLQKAPQSLWAAHPHKLECV
jgi:hypothetical protein